MWPNPRDYNNMSIPNGVGRVVIVIKGGKKLLLRRDACGKLFRKRMNWTCCAEGHGRMNWFLLQMMTLQSVSKSSEEKRHISRST